MAYLAPKQLSTSLPTVVPILGKTLSDPQMHFGTECLVVNILRSAAGLVNILLNANHQTHVILRCLHSRCVWPGGPIFPALGTDVARPLLLLLPRHCAAATLSAIIALRFS